MKKIWFWLLPALAFVGCKSVGKVSYSPERIVPTEKSVFWKITGNGLKKPSYLLGTIHLIPASQFHLPAGASQALDKVQRVTFEIDMKEMTNFRTQLSLMTKAMMGGGKTLKDLLSPADYAFVHQKLADKGMP
ncbi:MAG: TraB/GumN family protein, partial [Saprospiraceae bacterium]